MTNKNRLTRLAAAGVASAALIATVACNGNGIDTVRAEQRDPRLLQTAANGSPLGTATVGNQQMLVNCGPYQRTLVRTTYLNGQPVASVDCVPAEELAPAGYAAQPQQFAPAAQPVVYRTVAPAPRVVRTVSAPRTVTQRVYTERRPVRSKTKSAVIIGTSAAAGAGVGALIGGKKGAIIGAVAGGGGAAVWDQITRRKNQ
ncbi:MAG: hypothetical protein WD690_16275 [Vicinamibacterales bacterium]